MVFQETTAEGSIYTAIARTDIFDPFLPDVLRISFPMSPRHDGSSYTIPKSLVAHPAGTRDFENIFLAAKSQ